MDLNNLSDEVKAKAMECESQEDLLKLAKEEGIEISEDDVTAGLEKMAAASGGKTTAADLRKQIEENDRLDGYKEQLAAEKALDFVLAAAK